jgi:hypothetical protein
MVAFPGLLYPNTRYTINKIKEFNSDKSPYILDYYIWDNHFFLKIYSSDISITKIEITNLESFSREEIDYWIFEFHAKHFLENLS